MMSRGGWFLTGRIMVKAKELGHFGFRALKGEQLHILL